VNAPKSSTGEGSSLGHLTNREKEKPPQFSADVSICIRLSINSSSASA
jgi:hypothetical protein